MRIEITLAWAMTLVLVHLRIALLFFLTPLDGLGRIPTRIKLLVSLALAAALVSALELSLPAQPQNVVSFVVAALSELVVGLTLAFGFYCATGSVAIAGQLLDYQGGFGSAAIMNPAANATESLFGSFLTLFFIVCFFAADGVSYMLRAFGESLRIAPPNSGIAHLSFSVLMRQFGIMFTLGLSLAMPVIAALLLVDTAVGVMARSMPQLNVYFLFLPIKLCLVLLFTAMSLHYVKPWLDRSFSALFGFWLQALGN